MIHLAVQPILRNKILVNPVLCHNQNTANTTVVSQTIIYDVQINIMFLFIYIKSSKEEFAIS